MKELLCLLAALTLILTFVPACAEESDPAWDNHRVFYEIFTGSFSDSDGDGIGDLRGIINRMDYLNDGDPDSGKSLGIEGIWLTPIFESPSYHKYDVTDYYRIDPAFGTEGDLKDLIACCHERGVKLILDLPLNHTGNLNRWFIAFADAHRTRDEGSEYYDFYTWLEEGETPPAGRQFRLLPDAGVQYECNFSEKMPELNFDNEQVRQAVLDIAKYYLALGVDGFRFDAAKYPYLGENDRNIDFWEWYLRELKKTSPGIYTVAEVWDGEGVTNRYAKAVDCFHFATSQAEGLYAETAKAGDVNKLTHATERYLGELRQVNPETMNIPFISNHDMDRAAGYLTMASGRMAMAANLYILTPGSPFLYYGEEIGLRGSRGGANTDANRRLRMLWGDGDTVRDPEGSDYGKQTTYSVKDLEKIPGSLLNHYRKVIAVRRANPEIARGDYRALAFRDTKMGGFLCSWRGKTVGVFHNTTDRELTVDLKEATEQAFTGIAAVLEAIPGEGGAALEGTVLTLGAQTSAVLR
jgi:glycosidase